MTPERFEQHAEQFWDNITPSNGVKNQNILTAYILLGAYSACLFDITGKRSDLSCLMCSFKLKSLAVLCNKGNEYSTEQDKLHNFKHAVTVAKRYGYKIDPVQAAFGFQLKHLVSIDDMVEGRRKFDEDMLFEKFGDAINYCILIDAIETEQRENSWWYKVYKYFGGKS